MFGDLFYINFQFIKFINFWKSLWRISITYFKFYVLVKKKYFTKIAQIRVETKEKLISGSVNIEKMFDPEKYKIS